MTIRQKNIAVLGGFVTILILGYFLSIRDTLLLRDNYKRLQNQQLLFSNIPQRMQMLQQKQYYYDSLLNHYQITETSLQNNLLKTIERYATGRTLNVKSFNEPHTSKQANGKIISYVFRVSGDFQSILGLVYELEQRSKFGMIASLYFEKIKNYRTGKERLEAEFILQLIQ